jgi:hypothetical protein
LYLPTTRLTDVTAADTLPKAKGAGDAFIMRNILHDWPDADCTAILKVRSPKTRNLTSQPDNVSSTPDTTHLVTQALRTAIGDSGATVVLLEMSPVDDVGDPMGFSRYQMDLHMMAMCDGKERTRQQWEVLLASAGFKLTAMKPTRSIIQVIEATVVAGTP